MTLTGPVNASTDEYQHYKTACSSIFIIQAEKRVAK